MPATSSPGSARTSTSKRQKDGTMLVAVPPSMRVTCSVANGGSKRRSIVVAASSRSISSSSTSRRPA